MDGPPLGEGIHADIARVNVNCWITPDDANLAGGTPVIYYSHAPRGYSVLVHKTLRARRLIHTLTTQLKAHYKLRLFFF